MIRDEQLAVDVKPGSNVKEPVSRYTVPMSITAGPRAPWITGNSITLPLQASFAEFADSVLFMGARSWPLKWLSTLLDEPNARHLKPDDMP